MKFVFLILIILVFHGSFGQNSKSKIYLNEFDVSVNHTALKNKNIENQFGFGIGVYRTNFDTHKINLILGFEYNMTNLKVNDLMEGSHFSTLKNVTYVCIISLSLLTHVTTLEVK